MKPMLFSPRNQVEVATLPASQISDVDNLFDICDAEFNSRNDIHRSFESAKGHASWARYFLLHEVRKIAERENIMCSYHIAYIVASKISQLWFEQKMSA